MAVQSKVHTAQSTPVKRLSLSPDTFTSGGLLDDADIYIKDAQFLMWDYEGKVPQPVPALGLTLRILGEEDDPDESKDHDQFYSCGSADDFRPLEDGSGLEPLTGKSGLNNGCNAGLLLASLAAVGVPKTLMADGDIRSIIGLKVHVNRVPAPDRGFAAEPGKKKQEVLVVTKLLALPGEAGKPGGQPASKPGLSKVSGNTTGGATSKPGIAAKLVAVSSPATVVVDAEADPEMDAKITGTLLEILGANGGTVPRKMVGPKLFAAFKGDPQQTLLMKRGASEGYLETMGDGTFLYDGANISLAE